MATDGLKKNTKEKEQIEGFEWPNQSRGKQSEGFSVSFKTVFIYLSLRASKAEDQLLNRVGRLRELLCYMKQAVPMPPVLVMGS